jgi:DNA-directed RNA polymerase subunit E'/Rpb7
MLQFLESKLYSDVEGTCSGQFGYIIAVVSILDIGKGMVIEGTGQAEFITRYRAIVFKPFKGEVVDGVVNNVNKVHPCSHVVSFYLTLTRPLDGVLCRCRAFDSLRLTSSTFFRLHMFSLDLSFSI